MHTTLVIAEKEIRTDASWRSDAAGLLRLLCERNRCDVYLRARKPEHPADSDLLAALKSRAGSYYWNRLKPMSHSYRSVSLEDALMLLWSEAISYIVIGRSENSLSCNAFQRYVEEIAEIVCCADPLGQDAIRTRGAGLHCGLQRCVGVSTDSDSIFHLQTNLSIQIQYEGGVADYYGTREKVITSNAIVRLLNEADGCLQNVTVELLQEY